jgi:hypothetical protein
MLNSVQKFIFLINEGPDVAMSHSQLPPNSDLEPPNFDLWETPTSAFLPTNADGFGTGITVAFE